MNLRILKKLSKRAAPYLEKLGDTREQFKARKGENHTGWRITARKHWERCPSCHTDTGGRDGCLVIAPKSRAGTRYPYVKIYDAGYVRKGTAMVGATEGYYEPEWYEETAFEALFKLVADHFSDVVHDAQEDDWGVVLTRDLSTHTALFAAADEMIAEFAITQQRGGS